MISSWPGKFLPEQMTRPANRSGRRRASRFSSVCSPAWVLPRIAPSTARPARAVSATIRSRGNGAAASPSCSAVPVQPNIARFAGVSARFTSIPSAAHTVIPASSTADGSSSPISGLAASQNTDSITSAGTSSRHPVTTFPVGTCHSRANGTSASSPARRASASQYDPSGIRVIAIISRITSGYDMIRRRSRFLSRPSAIAASATDSITPSPR